tara:strand:- start:5827 stop:6192 length:366 start_codon:yes stop_codon:yes gene_type:complete
MKFFQAGGCFLHDEKAIFTPLFFFFTQVVSQKSFKTSLHFFSSLFWTLFLFNIALSVILIRARKRESERERDDGFFFFIFFFFVLSCARLSSRTTTLQFGFVGVKENDGEEHEDSQEEERF